MWSGSYTSPAPLRDGRQTDAQGGSSFARCVSAAVLRSAVGTGPAALSVSVRLVWGPSQFAAGPLHLAALALRLRRAMKSPRLSPCHPRFASAPRTPDRSSYRHPARGW